MAKEGKKTERGFTVTDRRHGARGPGGTGGAAPGAAPEQTPPREAGAAGGGPRGAALPREASLEVLVGFLEGNALLSLGAVPGARGERGTKDLARARLLIDLIALLGEKTRGNLTPREESLLEEVLDGLRLLYVREAG